MPWFFRAVGCREARMAEKYIDNYVIIIIRVFLFWNDSSSNFLCSSAAPASLAALRSTSSPPWSCSCRRSRIGWSWSPRTPGTWHSRLWCSPSGRCWEPRRESQAWCRGQRRWPGAQRTDTRRARGRWEGNILPECLENGACSCPLCGCIGIPWRWMPSVEILRWF